MDNDLHAATVIDEQTQQTTDKAEQKCAEHRRPKAVYLESLDHERNELEKKRVDQWDEQAQRQDREGEGQDQDDRADNGVDKPQKERGRQGRQHPFHLYTRDDGGDDDQRQRIETESDQESHRVSPLVRLQVFCLWLVATVPGQETSMARRGPLARTHCAGTRRTFQGTSQGVVRGEASPLGEVNWAGIRLPELTLKEPLAGVETHPLAARGLAETAWRDEQ